MQRLTVVDFTSKRNALEFVAKQITLTNVEDTAFTIRSVVCGMSLNVMSKLAMGSML